MKLSWSERFGGARIKLHNGKHLAQALLLDILWARSVKWKLTNDGPTNDHEHCSICTDIFDVGDSSAKYRCEQSYNTKRYAADGTMRITVDFHFVCVRCYHRFVASDGVNEIEKIVSNDRGFLKYARILRDASIYYSSRAKDALNLRRNKVSL